MHLPIQLLSLRHEDADALKARWSGDEGSGVFEQENKDLRGIVLHDLDVTFPDGGGLSGFDFSHAALVNCTLENGEIRSRFALASFRGCRFVKCAFRGSEFTASRFSDCRFEDCVFVSDTRFAGCEFGKTQFKRLATDGVLFEDCSMDSNCAVDDPKVRKGPKAQKKAPEATPPETAPAEAQTAETEAAGAGVALEPDLLSGFYTEVSRAFGAGGVNSRKRDYFLKANDAKTTYQSAGLTKIGRHLLGDFAGYGVRPLRISLALLLVVIVFAVTFWRLTADLYGGFVLSFAGIFTMVSIAGVPWPYDWLFIVEGLLGMALFGLFIVSVANVWFDR